MPCLHRRLALAALLNTVIVAGEALAGWSTGSLSLLMDAVHNLSDELALICLVLACWWPRRLGRGGQRLANVLNSLGLVALGGLLVARAVPRLLDPPPVEGLVPLAAGLTAALLNAGVAWLLAAPAREHAAVRLAWLHNRGDVLVSLAPAAAGALVLLTGAPIFDPLVALLVAGWIIWSTLHEVLHHADELLWPADLRCTAHDVRRDFRGASAGAPTQPVGPQQDR